MSIQSDASNNLVLTSTNNGIVYFQTASKNITSGRIQFMKTIASASLSSTPILTFVSSSSYGGGLFNITLIGTVYGYTCLSYRYLFTIGVNGTPANVVAQGGTVIATGTVGTTSFGTILDMTTANDTVANATANCPYLTFSTTGNTTTTISLATKTGYTTNVYMSIFTDCVIANATSSVYAM